MKKSMIKISLVTALLWSTLSIQGQAFADVQSDALIQQSSVSAATRQKVIRTGFRFLGTPYEFGSNRSTTRTFDCSDFIRHIYRVGARITLPADSRSQAAYVKRKGMTTTNWRNLKPGSIMFFMAYKGNNKSTYSRLNKSKQRITHNAIYLGNGRILHTYSKKSGGVRIDSIKGKQFEYRFIFGGRV